MAFWILPTINAQPIPGGVDLALKGPDFPNLLGGETEYDLRPLLRQSLPDESPERIDWLASDIWKFVKDIAADDIAIVPVTQRRADIYEITGPCRFSRNSDAEIGTHYLPARKINHVPMAELFKPIPYIKPGSICMLIDDPVNDNRLRARLKIGYKRGAAILRSILFIFLIFELLALLITKDMKALILQIFT